MQSQCLLNLTTITLLLVSLIPSTALLSTLPRSHTVTLGRPSLSVIPSSTPSTTCTASVIKAKRNTEDNYDKSFFAGLPRKTVAEPLALFLTAQFILFMGVGAVIPTLPIYGKAIGLSSAANGIVISAPASALLLLARPAGGFADRARKPAILGGLALIAVSDLGTALATSLAPLIAARIGLGAGRCVSESGERGFLADIAGMAPDLRGRSLAAQQAVLALGIAVGAPIGGLIVEEYGPRAAFLCVTGAALAALVLFTFLPETVSDNSQKVVSDPEEESSAGAWVELLKEPSWRGLSLCEVGAKVGFAAKIASIPVLAAAVLPGGAAGAGALLSAAGLSGLVGAPLGGWLTDRTGARFTAIASGLVSGIGLILIPFALSRSASEMDNEAAVFFSVAVLLWSTAVAAQGPALTAIGQQLAPPGAEATAMALPRASGDAVYLVAPALLGVVADWAGAPMGAECAVAGACSLLGIAALFLFESQKAD